MKRAVWLSLMLSVFSAVGRADDTSQPYIDSVRKQLQKEGKPSQPDSDSSANSSSQPYIDSLKAKLAKPEAGAESDQPYIDSVRKANPSARPADASGSYTDQQKATLPAKEDGGAIAAVTAGKSDLQMKRDTNIHYAGGLRVDAPFTRNFAATGGASTPFSYNDIYGNGTLPSFSGFMELQPFHIESIFNVGVIGLLGLQYASGTGRFGVTGVAFTATTPFHFFEMPVAVGLDLRINLAKYIRPSFVLAPEAIGYLETRSDGVSGHHGYSTGLYGSAGVWFLMDWISRENTWDAYRDGIKHYYLTAELSKQTTFSGDVTFDATALSIGFAFEF